MSINPLYVTFGSDPELFFERDGKIIGAEKVIPTEGLKRPKASSWERALVVLDGVQAELHPAEAASLEVHGQSVAYAFEAIRERLKDRPEVTTCFKGVVDVSREELDALSDASRRLGCAPSENVYGDRPITVDAATYTKRSAGGHIHMALGGFTNIHNGGNVDARPGLVPLLDIFVGNTCVMLDRDPLAAERRQNYGRPGEFRRPKYGLEYRTLSNFWLRNFALMDLAFGMCNFALGVYYNSLNGGPYEQELINLIEIDKFEQAIETNDFELARRNFETIRPFLTRNLPEKGFPLSPSGMHRFIIFAEGVRRYGLERFFPEDPMTAWSTERRSFADFVSKVY